MLQMNAWGVQMRSIGHTGSIVRFLSLLAIVAPVAWACGQAPKQPVPQQPEFTVYADEVTLDLVVHDKKKRPVLDLKPDEIAVTDDEYPVKLNSFRLVTGKDRSEKLITLLFDRLRPAAGASLTWISLG